MRHTKLLLPLLLAMSALAAAQTPYVWHDWLDRPHTTLDRNLLLFPTSMLVPRRGGFDEVTYFGEHVAAMRPVSGDSLDLTFAQVLQPGLLLVFENDSTRHGVLLGYDGNVLWSKALPPATYSPLRSFPAMVVGPNSWLMVRQDTLTRFTWWVPQQTFKVDFKLAWPYSPVQDAAFITGSEYLIAICNEGPHTRVVRVNYVDGAILDDYLIEDFQAHAIVPLSGSQYAFLGQKDGVGWIQRRNAAQTLLWEKTMPQDVYVHEGMRTQDNRLVVTGQAVGQRMMAAMLDLDGNLIWRYEFAEARQGLAIVRNPDLGIDVALGLTDEGRLWLVCFDDDGNIGQRRRTDARWLDANGIRALAVEGDAGWFGQGHYHFPADSATSTFRQVLPWMSARTASGDTLLLVPAPDRQPLRFGPADAAPDEVPAFAKSWPVARPFIDYLAADAADGNVTALHALHVVTWPARGNPYFSYQGMSVPIDEPLAPFVDVDGDGHYDPFAGDRPRIKGEKMLWSVLTADPALASDTPFGPYTPPVEMRSAAYAWDCGADHVLSRTTFLEWTFRSLASEVLTDLRVGLYLDMDIGGGGDDLVGSLPDLDACMGYNGDAFDEEGYGADLPVQSWMSLSHPLAGMLALFPEGGGVPQAMTGLPQTAAEAWRLLHLNWADGTPLTQGGTGYDPASTDTAAFIWPGNPADSLAWSACSAGVAPANVVALPVIALPELAPGEEVTLRMALVTHPDQGTCPDADAIRAELAELRRLDSLGWFDLEAELWPEGIREVDDFPYVLHLPEGGTYQWSTGDTTASIEVLEPGWYEVTVTGPDGCMSWQDGIYLTDDLTAVSEPVAPQPLTIWPNPADLSFFVDAGAVPLSVLRVSDLAGRVVWSGRGMATEWRVPCASWPPGLYLVAGRTADGRVLHGKVVVAR